MMVTQKCVQCGHVYEFYQVRRIMKDCPHCGASGGYSPPIVWPTKEDLESMKAQ